MSSISEIHSSAPAARESVPRRFGVQAGWSAVAVLAVAAALHVYWALGGDWAAATAYGDTDLPPSAVVWAMAAAIVVAILTLLGRLGAWGRSLPAVVFRAGTWAVTVVVALVAVGNLLAPAGSYGRAWHVFLIGPLLLVLAGLCALLARTPDRGAATRS